MNVRAAITSKAARNVQEIPPVMVDAGVDVEAVVLDEDSTVEEAVALDDNAEVEAE